MHLVSAKWLSLQRIINQNHYRWVANYKRLLRLTDASFHRYMYDKVNWNGRLVGIVGARGVGKTTMILQYIKEQLDVDSTLCVNAEDFFFS